MSWSCRALIYAQHALRCADGFGFAVCGRVEAEALAERAGSDGLGSRDHQHRVHRAKQIRDKLCAAGSSTHSPSTTNRYS